MSKSMEVHRACHVRDHGGLVLPGGRNGTEEMARSMLQKRKGLECPAKKG